mmetsp:Transcript_6667/g.27795  ORF Transcript_6667/g.27795 Transcript_6667/m.27795 type:complete len:226 (+) Transcript_6667:203-880(+)
MVLIGATGRSRIVSWAQASTKSSWPSWARSGSAASPSTRSTSARACASASGWRDSSQIIQARVLAVVSSPASSIVSTLPATWASSMPLPGSSAATSMASSRLPGALRRPGSALRRARAWAMKPCTATSIAATLCASARSSAPGHQRQVGSGENMRLNSIGKMRLRCCWITSSSDCRVLTSAPKAKPATASTVKRIRSACSSMRRSSRAACCQRPTSRSATLSRAG